MGADHFDNDLTTDASNASGSMSNVDIVCGSELFNPSHYANIAGVDGDIRLLVDHYLSTGEATGLSPSPYFDPAFYLATNPDVADARVSPFVHFVSHGQFEGRYPTKESLRGDAAKLKQSGLFDENLFRRYRRDFFIPGLDDIELYLVVRGRGLIFNENFNDAFYAESYDDYGEMDGKPILHYINTGRSERRVTSQKQLDELANVIRGAFDPIFYCSQLPNQQSPEDPLRHYILNGARLGYDPNPEFSRDYYLRRYPDLAEAADLEPFVHYVLYGKNEGRAGRLELSDWVRSGKAPYDATLPSLLIVVHEASHTGAPLLGYMLAKSLSARYNIVSCVCSDGPLLEDFLTISSAVAVGRPPSLVDAEYILRDLNEQFHFEGVVINSVENMEYSEAALYAGIPSVALVHEFAEYTRPAGKTTAVIESADRIIVPAMLVLESVQSEVKLHRGGYANNITVRPQGVLAKLPSIRGAANDLSVADILTTLDLPTLGSGKIVVGAGYVQMRKGVDLFVQTAREVADNLDDDVRFLWVGSGFDPDRDITFSIWVAELVKRLNLQDIVHFIKPQSDLSLLFEIADAFYLPSRLDPFPNVALDAHNAGKPIVCFDDATGIAAHIHAGTIKGKAVPYCHTSAAAAALVEILRSKPTDNGQPLLEERSFNFEGYVEYIESELRKARLARSEFRSTADRILEAGAFDARFHDGARRQASSRAASRSAIAFVARASKGLFCHNPRPGFNEGRYWSMHAEQIASRPAIDVALASRSPGQRLETHRCIMLDEQSAEKPFGGRVALHVHLHYADLATELVARLNVLKHELDVFVTVTIPKAERDVRRVFMAYDFGNVEVVTVPNRGRDIGPLVAALRDTLAASDYDIIGHVHGKRSVDVGSGVGDRWRSFLLDTLLGDQTNIASIFSLFDSDKNLGLLFAEDRHCVGWSKNLPYATLLADRMTPRPTLPTFPVFPIGTMFWARREVLVPFWSAQLVESEFPIEPAPYDGTILHAMERMLPSVCESVGLEWATLYRDGMMW